MDTAAEAPLTISREDLYELAWSKPMSELAKDFGISDVGLAKRCRKLGIPIPGRGYWARVDAGQKPYRPTLPAREPQVLDYSALIVAPSADAPSCHNGLPVDSEDGGPLTDEAVCAKSDAAWLAERTAFEERPENLVRVVDETRWHPVMSSIKDDLVRAATAMRASRKASDAYDKWSAARKGREMCEESWKWRQAVDRGQRLADTRHAIAFRVSLGCYERALRIVNQLALSAGDRGFKIREDKDLGRIIFAGHGVDVQMRVAEDLDTKTRPRVRYDKSIEQEKYKVPTGRLRITVQTDWRDGPIVADHGKATLESKLNRVFVTMYRIIVKHRAYQRKLDAFRRERDEAERQRQEAKRIRDEQLRQAAEERSRRRALIVEARRWNTARLLREYVAHIRAAPVSASASTDAWSDWALKIASDLDPTPSRLSGAPPASGDSKAGRAEIPWKSPGSIVLPD